jgi:DNA-binding transcriptional MocR family regulator
MLDTVGLPVAVDRTGILMVYALTALSVERMLGTWKGDGPAYTALADSFRTLILDGRLPSGSRLPSERLLAPQLKVSRNTVAAAYRALREDGYLHSRQGTGSFVAIPEAYRQADRVVSWAPAPPRSGDRTSVVDFTIASFPPPAAFLHRATRTLGDDLSPYRHDTGYDLKGVLGLRQAIADRYTATGLPTDASEIMVTAGAKQAWTLLLRQLTGRRDSVLVDVPTYPGALDSARTLGRRLLSVGIDDESGWDADLIASVIKRERPPLSYFLSGFHNPTGRAVPTEVQARVVAAAEEAGTFVVLDETLADLALTSRPSAERLFRRRSTQVVHIGSLSKICWAGMRLGWLRAPAQLVSRIVDLRASVDAGNSVLTELAAEKVLGFYDELVRDRRTLLAQRREVLTAALRELAPRWRFREPDGGLSLWVDLGAPVSSRLALAAADYGVVVVPGTRFGLDGTLDRHVRLPFLHDREVTRDGVRRLAAAFSDVTDVGNAAAAG